MPATSPPGQHHREHERRQRAGPAPRRARRASPAPRARRGQQRSATHSIAPKIRNASPRCAVRRNCDTRGSSTSPLLHHVPAHRALQPAEQEDARRASSRSRAGSGRATRNTDERHEEDDADQPPEQAVEVLPPEDALELLQRHAVVDEPVLGRLPVLVERLLPVPRRSIGGSVPTIGCHSTIDRPECVRRVTPPTTTIGNTRAQQAAQPGGDRARRAVAKDERTRACAIGGARERTKPCANASARRRRTRRRPRSGHAFS